MARTQPRFSYDNFMQQRQCAECRCFTLVSRVQQRPSTSFRWEEKRRPAFEEGVKSWAGTRERGEGYGVIVLNPNENYIEVEKTKAQVQLSSDSSDEPAEKRERKDKIQKETKKRRDFYEKYRNPQKEKETVQMYIRDNGSPEEHAIYVWDHFISQSAAENVFFVAHSYGGLAFVELMIQREAEVKNKVTAVALTDSVHNVWHQEAGKTIREWMRENCCNWVSSSEPLDTSVESMLPDCPRVSAGTERHELTSWKSFPSIFKFFSEAIEAKNSSVKPAPTRRSNRIKYDEF
ncbi:protein FAM172A [Nothoprocta perdicaria]|uniref:protein FAM172A n=1 Tax=Nothoprocta perdicaria TaxID=30464 RepID=UPI000E1B6DE6|nr:protein FAM172A [Nothoprocta perdicaria]